MAFDFFLPKTKAVIAMAHIGALPGAPGYDSRGGMEKLIGDVIADIHNLQAGGVDAIMFGNENDRPYVLKAPPEGLAAFAAIVQAVKPELKVPFGGKYLPAYSLPTWGFGRPIAPAPHACALRSAVPT
jgi:predicted TIM-barrel enzyme